MHWSRLGLDNIGTPMSLSGRTCGARGEARCGEASMYGAGGGGGILP